MASGVAQLRKLRLPGMSLLFREPTGQGVEGHRPIHAGQPYLHRGCGPKVAASVDKHAVTTIHAVDAAVATTGAENVRGSSSRCPDPNASEEPTDRTKPGNHS
jgi:hypothetical protein